MIFDYNSAIAERFQPEIEDRQIFHEFRCKHSLFHRNKI